jgi:hypothetical protein
MPSILKEFQDIPKLEADGKGWRLFEVRCTFATRSLHLAAVLEKETVWNQTNNDKKIEQENTAAQLLNAIVQKLPRPLLCKYMTVQHPHELWTGLKSCRNSFAPLAAPVGLLRVAQRPPHSASRTISHFRPLCSRHVAPQSSNASAPLPNQNPCTSPSRRSSASPPASIAFQSLSISRSELLTTIFALRARPQPSSNPSSLLSACSDIL